MRKMIIGVDVDSVLYACSEYAAELLQRKKLLSPPLAISEVTWQKSGGRADAIFEYFNKKSFWKKQPLLTGAREAIKALIDRGHKIIVLSDIPSRFMSLRAKRLAKDFKLVVENLQQFVSLVDAISNNEDSEVYIFSPKTFGKVA